MLVEWCQVEEARFVNYFIILGVLLPACSTRLVCKHCKVRWWCNVRTMQKGVSSCSFHKALDATVKEVSILTNTGVRWPDGSIILLLQLHPPLANVFRRCPHPDGTLKRSYGCFRSLTLLNPADAFLAIPSIAPIPRPPTSHFNAIAIKYVCCYITPVKCTCTK